MEVVRKDKIILTKRYLVKEITRKDPENVVIKTRNNEKDL
jgi:hypothetical protein